MRHVDAVSCCETHWPPGLKRIQNQVYGPGFQAWAVYQRVALRLSYGLIAQAAQDFLHVDIIAVYNQMVTATQSSEADNVHPRPASAATTKNTSVWQTVAIDT